MLVSLHIQDFAIVKSLELDFAAHMTAFTGETGAGKSIMIDALMLALGGRGDGTVVRPGAEKCEIHAHFHIDSPSQPAEWLLKHDIDLNDGDIVLRRQLSAEGRSKAWVNGEPLPLQKIKELSEMLIHIHGQHEHQTLLNHNTHRIQLDRYTGHLTLQEDVQSAYKQYQAISQKIETLSQAQQDHHAINLCAFQIKELSELNLIEGEWLTLNQEHQRLHHAQDYIFQVQQTLNLINDNDEGNVAGMLHMSLQALNQLPQDEKDISASQELLNTALIQVDEAKNLLSHFLNKIQADPERLHEVESRISLLHKMSRKYQCAPDVLYTLYCELQDKHKDLQNGQKSLENLKLEQQKMLHAYEQTAQALRDSRLNAASRLSDALTMSIQQLGMPHGYMQIEVTPTQNIQSHGMDKVEYKVCTNPGLKPSELAKVASGGELSRISLAIQILTAEKASTPTLIFDEVDVGIGGATATLVGRMLRTLGDRLQVFCVTHQPQVAANAHHQFKISKSITDGQTFSEVKALDKSTRVEEIARMLGGATTHGIQHAEELLQVS